jgi:hypothetical protein
MIFILPLSPAFAAEGKVEYWSDGRIQSIGGERFEYWSDGRIQSIGGKRVEYWSDGRIQSIGK